MLPGVGLLFVYILTIAGDTGPEPRQVDATSFPDSPDGLLSSHFFAWEKKCYHSNCRENEQGPWKACAGQGEIAEQNCADAAMCF